MPNNPKPAVKPHSIYFYVIWGAVLFAFIRAFHILSPILLSFLLILLISLAINPLVFRMRALTGGRTVATGLLVVAWVMVIALTGWAFFGPMKTSFTDLAEQLPIYWERLQKPLIKMEQQAVLSEAKFQTEVSTAISQPKIGAGEPEAKRRTTQSAPLKIDKEPGSLRSSLGQMLQGVAGSFSAVTFNAAQLLFVLVTVFFGVIFTLTNPRPIFGALFLLVPERHHGQALTIVQRIVAFVPSWAGATLLEMAIIALLVFLLMWPIFGFMTALALGLIAGFLEAVPYMGPLLAAVPALLLAVSKGGMTPVWVAIAYTLVQALENNVILPLIMARNMKMHPVAVIFSMLFCVAAFGVLGALVAAPMVAIVSILHEELYQKRFLPHITDADLDRLARKALHENVSADKGESGPTRGQTI